MQVPKSVLCPYQGIWVSLRPNDEGTTTKIMDVQLVFEQIFPYVQLVQQNG